MGSQTSVVVGARPDVTAGLNAIRRIVRALRLSASASERVLGVSGAQLFVLQQLSMADGPSIAELAERTATDPSSVSVVIGRLVERGLAARRVSKVDARRAEVVITAAGRALLRKAPEPIQARLLEGLASLPSAQLRALVEGLEAVVNAMGVEENAAAMFFEEEAPKRKRQRRRADERTTIK